MNKGKMELKTLLVEVNEGASGSEVSVLELCLLLFFVNVNKDC